MVGADVIERRAERAWWGSKRWAALNQPGLITRRPKATDAAACKPLPAAALVLPTQRLPAMRFKPRALQPGRVPQRPREEPQEEGVRRGGDAYLDEGIGGHGGAKCAPRVRDRLSVYKGSGERRTARGSELTAEEFRTLEEMLSGFEGFEGPNEEQWKRKWYNFVPPDGVRDSVGDEVWITFRSILPHGTWVAWGDERPRVRPAPDRHAEQPCIVHLIGGSQAVAASPSSPPRRRATAPSEACQLGVSPGHWAHREPTPHGEPAV